MKKAAVLAVSSFTCLSLILSGCNVASGGGRSASDTSRAAVGASVGAESGGIMSSFSTVDLNGKTVNESILKNKKLTLVNVWATYCGSCMAEMKDLGELSQEYGDKGVSIVGVVADALDQNSNVDSGQVATAKEIVDSLGASYTHLVASPSLSGVLSQAAGVPATVLINGGGEQIGSVYLGYKSKDEWKNIIDETLKGLS